MAGRIEVESVLGEGSTFSLVLPRCEPVGATPDHPVVVTRPVAGRAVDLLYIEDNPANQTLMARIARLRPSATLRLAPTGTAGVEAAQERTPDLVLLDLHLPDIQGDEVLARLRSRPALARVPVVVVTADATPGLDERLRALGADGVITKTGRRRPRARLDRPGGRTATADPAAGAGRRIALRSGNMSSRHSVPSGAPSPPASSSSRARSSTRRILPEIVLGSSANSSRRTRCQGWRCSRAYFRIERAVSSDGS